MTAQQIIANEIVTFDDLKRLARAEGPCITIAANISGPRELSTRLKDAARAVENALASSQPDPAARQSLLEPIHALPKALETARIWPNALIVFRSPDLFQYFLLRRRAPEVESVESRFQAGPLLAAIASEQRFHLLGLSRKRIRLLECTPHRTQEVALRGLVPTDFHSWRNTGQPDHLLENRSSAGPGAGSMKGVSFGMGGEEEHEDRALAHFFQAVDAGVNTLLRGATKLVAMGVEEELAVYRRVTVYPRLFKKMPHGSPDPLSDAELHQQAMDVAAREPSEPLEISLSHFERHRNRHLVSPEASVKAAWEGRVSDLFLREGAQFRGAFDEAAFEIDGGNPREDLLNAAALETVLHGGQAFVLGREEMPAASDVIAVLRF